jgi:RNA polymerase sigma factor (TIGR02999 family)
MRLAAGHVIARSEAERQALALMDHQNVSKVLDAGPTESGRPLRTTMAECLIVATAMNDVTRILSAINDGNARAADELFPLVYEELRGLAARELAHEAPGQTLQATALVHEAYLRLVEVKAQHWNSLGHFYSAAAEAMRRILVDRARKKRSTKHGGGQLRHSLDEANVMAPELGKDLVALDDALEQLAADDAEAAQLVKLRFFAGLTLAQAAAALGISPRTADRAWSYARSFLLAELKKGRD